MENEQEQKGTAPDQSSAVQPTRKGYLTEEQARIINLMRSYEKAYIRASVLSGHWLILNGDETERVFKSTMKALIGKKHLVQMAVGKWKLAE